MALIIMLSTTFTIFGQLSYYNFTPNDSTFKVGYEEIARDFTEKYDLTDLQKKEFKDSDFEVRIWNSVSNGCDGVFIVNKNNIMSVYYLDDLQSSFDRILDIVGLYKPEINLLDSNLIETKLLWAKLMGNDILNLPDEEVVIHSNVILDGSLYIVEIGNDLGYRCYHYVNPELYQVEEAKKMTKIINIINNDIINKL